MTWSQLALYKQVEEFFFTALLQKGSKRHFHQFTPSNTFCSLKLKAHTSPSAPTYKKNEPATVQLFRFSINWDLAKMIRERYTKRCFAYRCRYSAECLRSPALVNNVRCLKETSPQVRIQTFPPASACGWKLTPLCRNASLCWAVPAHSSLSSSSLSNLFYFPPRFDTIIPSSLPLIIITGNH